MEDKSNTTEVDAKDVAKAVCGAVRTKPQVRTFELIEVKDGKTEKLMEMSGGAFELNLKAMSIFGDLVGKKMTTKEIAQVINFLSCLNGN